MYSGDTANKEDPEYSLQSMRLFSHNRNPGHVSINDIFKYKCLSTFKVVIFFSFHRHILVVFCNPALLWGKKKKIQELITVFEEPIVQ